MDCIVFGIASGSFQPGEKLPSVRNYSKTIGVNPNTIQYAFRELKKSGIITTKRNLGYFVTEDITLIERTRVSCAEKAFKEYCTHMLQLGFSVDEMKKFFTESYRL